MINTIHDAIYLYIKDNADVINFVHYHLLQIMGEDYKENQPRPLTSELDIGYNWAYMITLPNTVFSKEIKKVMLLLKSNLTEEEFKDVQKKLKDGFFI